MKVFKYWLRRSKQIQIKGKPWKIISMGFSNESLEDAEQKGESRLENIIRRFQEGQIDNYFYSDRPLKEELKEEINVDGSLFAAITRNAYGSLILNTKNVMFIDIDNEAENLWKFLSNLLKKLMGKNQLTEEILIEKIKEKVKKHNLGLNLYKTYKGYRCLVTNKTFEPKANETATLLKEFGCDKLFITLCKAQESFRARLTPKPWRVGLSVPKNRFPWKDQAEEDCQREWENKYEEKILNYSTCLFLGHFGDETIDLDIENIVNLHDKYTLGNKALA